MNIKNKVNLKPAEFNPLVKFHRKRMRSRLKSENITFLCPNCIGGILFHDLGLEFQSPTINLMMTQHDFLKFITDPEKYLNGKLEFFEHESKAYPCAKLYDITVNFTHYETKEEAESKWNLRKLRIDKDNTFIFLMERDGLTKQDIMSLGKLPVRGILVFTANDYPDIPYTLFLPKYNADGEVGNILKKSHLNRSREYEKYFDFVKWFNEADGKNFDVSPFVRKF